MPNDAFFEISGVLQFFVALVAGYYGYQVVRNRHQITEWESNSQQLEQQKTAARLRFRRTHH
jgi:hypothetical protein